MTEEDLAQILSDFQARMIAHEEILRAFIVKVAGEHSLSIETRAQWVSELRRDIRSVKREMIEIKNHDPEYVAISKDVDKFIDRVIK